MFVKRFWLKVFHELTHSLSLKISLLSYLVIFFLSKNAKIFVPYLFVTVVNYTERSLFFKKY